MCGRGEIGRVKDIEEGREERRNKEVGSVGWEGKGGGRQKRVRRLGVQWDDG